MMRTKKEIMDGLPTMEADGEELTPFGWAQLEVSIDIRDVLHELQLDVRRIRDKLPDPQQTVYVAGAPPPKVVT